MKTDCAALRQSKTNPATAGSTTNTIASGDDENNDHDDGDSAKCSSARPESTELRKLAPGHALHLVYIIIIIQLYIRVYISYTCVYNYNYTTIS